MRVLMLESHPGVGHETEAQLVAAGHSIVRCDSTDRTMPCRGLAAEDHCPLDAPVDVAVVVQEPGLHQVEHGALCAARDRVPVVEVAPTRAAAASPIATLTAYPGDDVLDACERAARDGRAHERAVARRLLQLGVVTAAELDEDGGVVGFQVERSATRLRMTIVLTPDARHREQEIVRAATQALRDYDRQVNVIDVVVRTGLVR